MTTSLKSIEKRIEKLEKLKQIANYRYSQGHTTDLKEVIELEKISLSTDRHELVKMMKRETIMMKAIQQLIDLKNHEVLSILSDMLTDMILESGLDTSVYDEAFKSLLENRKNKD